MANSREKLRELGINSPETLAAWSQKRGLLGVFIRYTPARPPVKPHWQVVWPGRNTAPVIDRDPPWRRGIQTFYCRNLVEKDMMEARARTWASGRFNVAEWTRIEGAMGGVLFPDAVYEELKRLVPEIRSRKERQHLR